MSGSGQQDLILVVVLASEHGKIWGCMMLGYYLGKCRQCAIRDDGLSFAIGMLHKSGGWVG